MTKVLKPFEKCDKEDCKFKNVNTPQASDICWGLREDRDTKFLCDYYEGEENVRIESNC